MTQRTMHGRDRVGGAGDHSGRRRGADGGRDSATDPAGRQPRAPGLPQVLAQRRARPLGRSPKVSARAGLVYTYTKPPRSDGQDAWYLTALDFDTGRRIWRRLAGEGLGYNNDYAPVTIAPNGTAYVGVLGGLVKFRDAPGR
jgi:hypothetical protein